MAASGGHPAGTVKVSDRGQMSLPAPVRHRWGIEDGGELGWIDLRDAILFVPGGVTAARRAVLIELDDRAWNDARDGFGDPDLANQ